MEEKRIENAFRMIFTNPTLFEEFKQSKSLEKMYEIVTSVEDGYTIDEFETYLMNVVGYAQNCFKNGKLNKNKFRSIFSEKIFGKSKKILASGLASLMMITSFMSQISADPSGVNQSTVTQKNHHKLKVIAGIISLCLTHISNRNRYNALKFGNPKKL